MVQVSKNPVVGCVGCGNMGGAILAGLAQCGEYQLYGHTRSSERMRPLMAKGVKSMADVTSLVRACDVLIIAVKPHQTLAILHDMQESLKPDKLLISVAAGVSRRVLEEGVNGICPVVRAMPNTPALVGAGVFALCMEDPKLTQEHKDLIHTLFGKIGFTRELPESIFPAFSALIGAGPAYVLHLMQALVQAGITLGFPAAESRRLVEALCEGSLRMAQQSPEHFMELRDKVCSPAGLTITGVNHLESMAVNGHIIEAVLEAYARGCAMEK